MTEWVLVPRDPTPEMLYDAWRAAVGKCDHDTLRSIYRAALQAAPQAEPVAQSRSQQLAAAGFSRRPSLWALQAREALELIAAPQRLDGTWNRDREACRQLAAEALGRYDDEPLQPGESK